MKITKPIYTSAGEVRPISWKQFVELIPVDRGVVRPDDDGCIQFNTYLGYATGSPDFREVEADIVGVIEFESDFLRVRVKLGPKDKMLDQLMNQAKWAMTCFTSIPELCEDIHLYHIDQYGEPEYMVHVGNRMWMAANPQDFRIYHLDGKYALACYQRARTLILNIKKVSEIESFTNEINQIAGSLNETGKDM